MLFHPQDVQKILSINLSHTIEVDKRIWRFSRDGKYTVRSGYHVLMEQVCDDSHLRYPGDWLKLWRLKMPQKIKLLAWRILRGCLPTRFNLQHKGVNCSSLCPQCESLIEDEWHIFFGCNKAVECWMQSRCWPTMKPILDAANSVNEAVFRMMSCFSLEMSREVLLMLWCLWRRRNDKLWKNEELPTQVVVKLAHEMLDQWVHVRRKDHVGFDLGGEGADLVWRKPSQGEFKCNVDAAIFKENATFGLGFCIRNDKGEFVVAKSMVLGGVPPAQEAEAIGLLEAIKWVCELGYHKMSIELDCKPVVEGVLGDVTSHTELGTIFLRCREELSKHINYGVSFIRRQANFVAHSLARAAKFHASHQNFHYIPTCIVELLLNEMN